MASQSQGKSQSESEPKGFLITLEGIDGSGKSTLAQFLSKALRSQGFKVVSTHEPGGTPVGRILSSLVRQNTLCGKAEFLLFIADRAEHLAKVVWPALAEGSIVICDRMIDSTWAYQGYGRGVDLDLIRQMNQWLLEQRVPDMTLYLRLDYEIARSRLQARKKLDGFEKQTEKFFRRVIEGYESLIEEQASESSRPRVVAVPADRPQQDVFENALMCVKQRLNAFCGEKCSTDKKG